MTEMIERLARKLCELDTCSEAGWDWDRAPESVRASYREAAAEALRTLREPDPRTSTAIMGAVHRVTAIYGGEVYVRGNAGEFIVGAMIDAILRQPTTSS